MNEFVSYLNSIHNIGGDSTGSLAEKQVTSPFFDMVKVDRQLGTYIADCVSSKQHKAFVLTGHAGDGKTSILVQVLKALELLPLGDKLEVQREYDDFYYVKDMSEVAEELQVNTLEKALKAPKSGKSSLLISNTGPLLKSITQLVEEQHRMAGSSFDEENRMALQTKILTQLDKNRDEAIEVEGFEFVLVNIARVDNVSFSVSMFKKLLDDGLWKDCAECPKAHTCPIKNNKDCATKYFERVSAFVENFYRFLYENDKRMTIRQMIGQLSFSLTGNLSCEDVLQKSLRNPSFYYNFANLFFGYQGLSEKKDSLRINGIEQLCVLNLDSIALDVDYDLFVKRDYKCFPNDVRTEIENLYKRKRHVYQVNDADDLTAKQEKDDGSIRKAIRRFYLVYSNYLDADELFHMFNQVFGPYYSDYQKLTSTKQLKPMLRKMRDLIFKALYMKNTGFLPDEQSILHLSLRREGDVFQSVMLVIGSVNKNDLEVIQVSAENAFEDYSGKQQIFLKLKNSQFPITLPMVTYFGELTSGAIASNNNPALTHGVAKLDALLIEEYGKEPPKNKEDCELTVLINTSRGQDIRNFGFDGSRLYVM